MTEPGGFACPVPATGAGYITMAHGGGGSMMHRLLAETFFPALDNPLLEQRTDAAVFRQGDRRFAFTTDTYVVRPLEFPGGSIGSLAVYGTVNDLAAVGARPLYLSAGFILEEGLPLETLRRVVQAMQAAAADANVLVVTGDTKVVDSGSGDGIFINTAGIGILEHELEIGPAAIRPGDVLIVNGDLGRHGMAVMAARASFEFESTLETDAAPLADLVQALLHADVEVHCIRDLTRGGLASALNELAEAAGVEIQLREADIPVAETVQSMCEILGLDPLYVANEGRMVFVVPESQAGRCLEVLRRTRHGDGACIIGAVAASAHPLVTLETPFGAQRILDLLSGDQLPRIC
jgi:hydrogenase expression/formation protein HypE